MGQRIQLCFVALLILIGGTSGRAEQSLKELKAAGDTYRDVVVVGKTDRHIYIQHAQGMANIRLIDLEPHTLTALGYDPNTVGEAVGKTSPGFFTSAFSLGSEVGGSPEEVRARLRERMQSLDASVLWALAGLGVAFYALFCFCMQKICHKTGHQPGVAVWIPIIQIFPMLQAANMSAIWFLGFLLPGLNVVASVMWCFKICQARGVNVWAGILLLLPVTSFFMFLYLAFGGSTEKPAEDKPKASDAWSKSRAQDTAFFMQS